MTLQNCFILKPVLFFMLIVSIAQGQSTESLIAEGEKLEANLQEKNALQKYEEALRIQPANARALYKCSELSARIGARETKEASKKYYYDLAIGFARKLIKLQPNDDFSYVAMCIALGKQALSKSGKEKIIYVKEIKSYAEKAIKINPGNYKAWHILGKWHYEVANLNFFEKSMLKLIYGGLPEASFKEAIHAYQQALKLHDQFMLNELELAKALYANDQEKSAVQWLKHIQTLSNKTEDDPIIKKEANQLLKKWE